MCQPNDKLLLCTCLDNDEERTKLPLKWILERYLGACESNIIGEVKGSTDVIDGLSIDDVIDQLNSRNCFDFDYVPIEKDSLCISNIEKKQIIRIWNSSF
ncbi:MAG: hypothetical protein K1X55_16390 [Chitinophagales bacterium]|nr:hypothetical protein [Chitinophagales bacterium]